MGEAGQALWLLVHWQSNGQIRGGRKELLPHSPVCLLFMINEQQTIARLAFSSDVFSGERSDSYGTFHRARMKNMREVTRSWYFFYPNTFQTSCLRDRCK